MKIADILDAFDFPNSKEDSDNIYKEDDNKESFDDKLSHLKEDIKFFKAINKR